MNRSAFLSGTAAAAIAAPGAALAYEQPDHIVRIEHAAIKVAPNRYVETTTYNGQFPGPLLRMREGRPVVIDVHNATLIPEQLHFHGEQFRQTWTARRRSGRRTFRLELATVVRLP